jgi:regulator of protease activity HflC (stomatin/prohibitin superfamily)
MNIASLFQGIAALAWMVVIGVVVLVVVRIARNRPMARGGTAILISAAAAVVLSAVSSGLVFINPQERGVVISAVSPLGYREQVLQPGLRWIIPFAETVVRYPVSKQTYTMSIAAAEGQIQGDDSIAARTADGQEIFMDASVIYAIDPTKVIQVHIQWQDRYANDLVRPLARGIVRDVVSQYGVEEVVSKKRLEMVEQVREAMALKLEANGLVLEDFVLRNITFSPEYAASVEQKQIAEQQAQQARFVVEQKKAEADQAREVAKGQKDAAITRAEGEAQSRIIQAQAEAEALRLIAAAIKENPDLLTYQYISKLSPNIQAMLLTSNAPFVFPLPTLQPGTVTSPTETP